jgi:6-phosphogluconate dehydrogenase (decarboxylating)
MVHNGIEYGVMAAFAEGLNIIHNANAGKTKSSWNNNRERMNFVCPQVSQAFGTEFIGAIV